MQNNKVHGVSQSTYTKLAVAHLKVTPACQTQVDGANNRSLSKGNLQPDASGSPQSQGVSLSLYLSLFSFHLSCSSVSTHPFEVL